MKKITQCVSLLMVSFLVSCASNQPESAAKQSTEELRTNPRSAGYLRVYSTTQTRILGWATYYYPHTGYTIMDPNGTFVKYVPNHVGTMDNAPSIVPIPAGHYLLRAESDWYGRATFPIEVKQGKKLVIHLERDGNQPKNNDDPRIIRLQDGRMIGWYE
ncbi:hypothetical protein [Pedosphaera parvula]|uniref:Lipoprotein n=1 Tax=Pedosphaera parvula (strain Ellin514) TaxID=320771 RepID=B9XF77_PEDPL|nr:hypothetical protein [Pedosphaera parvula]EEF61575.1 hypothetical protein Cflav_PD4253 [Pedosphaera parvula Ellin514]